MKDNKYTILIADDNEMDVLLLKKGISTSERNLVCVYSGEAVLQYVERDYPDLILLDVMMPDIDGYDVCRQLKQNKLTRHIPIIFLTSLTNTDDIAKGLELGAVDYIVKPYNLIEVNARIKNHLVLQKGHEQSLALFKGFATSGSDVAIMSNKYGEVLEFFGSYKDYFPNLRTQATGQNLSEILPSGMHKQFMSAIETVERTKTVFEFETEMMGGDKRILHTTMSAVNQSDVIIIKILDVTNRRTAERKMELAYEYQKRSLFFNGLLTGSHSQEQREKLMSAYGIDSRKPLICYVISTSVFDSAALSVASFRANIGEWLIEKGYGWIWNGNFGIGMLIQYPEKTAEIANVAVLLKESLEMRFPNLAVHIGVAKTEADGVNFKQLHYDALAALMMAIAEKREYAIAERDKVGLYELLVHALEHLDVDRFIECVLGKIQQIDLKNGGDLLKTLEQLIMVPSMKNVAANLFIHPNTVLWRKQKIEEILEISLDDADERTQINLALKLICIRNFIKKSDESIHMGKSLNKNE